MHYLELMLLYEVVKYMVFIQNYLIKPRIFITLSKNLQIKRTIYQSISF